MSINSTFKIEVKIQWTNFKEVFLQFKSKLRYIQHNACLCISPKIIKKETKKSLNKVRIFQSFPTSRSLKDEMKQITNNCTWSLNFFFFFFFGLEIFYFYNMNLIIFRFEIFYFYNNKSDHRINSVVTHVSWFVAPKKQMRKKKEKNRINSVVVHLS